MRAHHFEETSVLEERLVADVLWALSEGIRHRGSASILFSGGSTPKKLFEGLAKSSFEWEKVKVGLVDDRMVPKTSSASNANLLQAHFFDLITGDLPTFCPLVEWEDEADNIEQAMQSVVAIGIPDVVVLGMGGDGHFASLFPGDEATRHGLNPDHPAPLLYTFAPVEPRYRISHSWSYLRKARHHFLHLTGDAKRQIIEEHAKRTEKLPIDTVLEDRSINPVLYWAP